MYLSPELRRKNPHLAKAIDAVDDMYANLLPFPPWIVRWYRAKNVNKREMRLHETLRDGKGCEAGWDHAE